MKWKGLVVVLIIVGLLGGFIGVPVARADTFIKYVHVGASYGGLTDPASSLGVHHYLIGNLNNWNGSLTAGNWLGNASVSNPTCTSASYIKIDGVAAFAGISGAATSSYFQYAQTYINNVYTTLNCMVELPVKTGSHTYTWNCVDTTWLTWSGSWTGILANGMGALSVSITGSATAAIGVNTSFAAVIKGGTAPYSTMWHVDGTGGNEGVLLDASNVSPAGLTLKFATISHYIVRATVIDATATMASATFDVNLMSSKPVMHGQLVRSEAAEAYTFSMYGDGVVLSQGIVAASDCVPSAQYSVTSPSVMMQSEYGYQIGVVASLPNPLYVYVTWHVPNTGEVWSYRFTIDTSILTGAGTWSKSDGTGSDDGGTIAPTWVDGVLNKLKSVLVDTTKEAFQWLFVPTTDQMALLMPQGTVQADGTLSKEGNIAASLLDGTTWGAGASSWKLTVHYATFVITLVDIDFTAMRSSAFVRGIRFAVQAVMSMSLVYMIVVLI